MASSKNLQILRQLISEIRKASSAGRTNDSPIIRHILNQYRKYRITDKQLCKAEEEMKFMADTYLCYLKSVRLHKEIQQQFHGKGERTVADTAKMVGFKLPHDPK